jgi:hypothetical protein
VTATGYIHLYRKINFILPTLIEIKVHAL